MQSACSIGGSKESEQQQLAGRRTAEAAEAACAGATLDAGRLLRGSLTLR